jgi:MOSC domain-containing protein YiiM
MIVERLFTSPQHGAPQIGRRCIQLVAGQGIVGDRHFGSGDWDGQNLALVEAEEIEAFCAMTGRRIDLALTRRNIVTRGVRLNDLVGRRFRIGDCRLLGIERCEPCLTLGRLLEGPGLDVPAVVRYWSGRGGLRADALSDGSITVGDEIEILQTLGGYA